MGLSVVHVHGYVIARSRSRCVRLPSSCGGERHVLDGNRDPQEHEEQDGDRDEGAD